MGSGTVLSLYSYMHLTTVYPVTFVMSRLNGPAYMGNKGAVGVRFRVQAKDGGLGEVYT